MVSKSSRGGSFNLGGNPVIKGGPGGGFTANTLDPLAPMAITKNYSNGMIEQLAAAQNQVFGAQQNQAFGAPAPMPMPMKTATEQLLRQMYEHNRHTNMPVTIQGYIDGLSAEAAWHRALIKVLEYVEAQGKLGVFAEDDKAKEVYEQIFIMGLRAFLPKDKSL